MAKWSIGEKVAALGCLPVLALIISSIFVPWPANAALFILGVALVWILLDLATPPEGR